MITTSSLIEQRVTVVGAAVSELQRRLASLPRAPNWLEQVTDSSKDEQGFGEVLAFGPALRAAAQLPENIGELA
jgi:hypothetical protein